MALPEHTGFRSSTAAVASASTALPRSTWRLTPSSQGCSSSWSAGDSPRLGSPAIGARRRSEPGKEEAVHQSLLVPQCDEKSRSYREEVSKSFRAILPAVLILRDQVIAPILAGVRSPHLGRKP